MGLCRDRRALPLQHLLTTQSVRLTPTAVLAELGDEVELQRMRTFLVRATRRQAHQTQLARLLKQAAAADELATSLRTFGPLRARGGWIVDVDPAEADAARWPERGREREQKQERELDAGQRAERGAETKSGLRAARSGSGLNI